MLLISGKHLKILLECAKKEDQEKDYCESVGSTAHQCTPSFRWFMID